MPIEFHCPFCERLLRTPDEKAGLQADCPGCGEKIFVPHESEYLDDVDEVDDGGNRDWFDQLADLESESPARPATPRRTAPVAKKPCPMCGEEIDRAAVECPSCGEQFARESTALAAGGFHPQYAGFWLRFVAAFIDGLILAVPIGGLVFLFIMLDVQGGWPANLDFVPDQVWNLLAHALVWPYFAVMESSRFQGTFGKMALKIIVTDMEGERITFARASGRHFAKLISDVCCMLGYLTAAFDDKKQAWHDTIASCLIIRRP